MSSVAIITAIIVLLAVLICYAFIMQSISQKKQQKVRLLQAMKTRARNFRFMLNGFPTGFLPKELTLLVQSSLIDVLESLAKLEPGEASHKEELLNLTQQKTETQRSGSPDSGGGSIENPQQVREVKACLEELYKFVFHLEGKRRVTREQADAHRALIKQLVLQLTIDSYVLHGRIARDKSKPRLALHYFDLGLNLMRRERGSGLFEGRISQLEAVIDEIKANLAAEGRPSPAASQSDSDSPISEEWDEFGKQDSEWKKKQIYD